MSNKESSPYFAFHSSRAARTRPQATGTPRSLLTDFPVVIGVHLIHCLCRLFTRKELFWRNHSVSIQIICIELSVVSILSSRSQTCTRREARGPTGRQGDRRQGGLQGGKATGGKGAYREARGPTGRQGCLLLPSTLRDSASAADLYLFQHTLSGQPDHSEVSGLVHQGQRLSDLAQHPLVCRYHTVSVQIIRVKHLIITKLGLPLLQQQSAVQQGAGRALAPPETFCHRCQRQRY